MKPGYTMRDCQRNFCNAVVRSFDGKTDAGPVRRVLGAAATGAGKTIMASALIEHRVTKREQKCLFLADRDELVAQAADKLYKSTGIIAGLEKAERRANHQTDVVVGSIQSMSSGGRFERFAPDHFGLVIADEAHLSMAANWQRVLTHFSGDILGITATPERGDGIPLMKFYEHLAYEIPLKELIEQRYLSPIVVQTVPLEIAIEGKVKDGEMEDLAAELAAYHAAIIDAIETCAADRKSILIFHPSRKSSRDFTNLLLERGHTAKHVDGDSKDRDQTISGFTRGDFRFLNNAQLLTTGFDAPRIDCVIILRPTKSRTAYVQMAGRGTRLFCPHGCSEWCDHPERKQNMMLLDFLWQFPNMNLMAPACLTTDNKEQAEAITKKLREGGTKDILEVDAEAISEREERMIQRLRTAGRQKSMMVDACAFGALMHQPELMDYQPTAQWQRAKLTPKQAAFLTKLAIDPATVKDKGHASTILEYMVGRMEQKKASAKQVLLLAKHGHADAINLTFQEASERINNLFSRA